MCPKVLGDLYTYPTFLHIFIMRDKGQSGIEIPPENNKYHLKREPFQKEKLSPNHHFSRDILVCRVVRFFHVFQSWRNNIFLWDSVFSKFWEAMNILKRGCLKTSSGYWEPPWPSCPPIKKKIIRHFVTFSNYQVLLLFFSGNLAVFFFRFGRVFGRKSWFVKLSAMRPIMIGGSTFLKDSWSTLKCAAWQNIFSYIFFRKPSATSFCRSSWLFTHRLVAESIFEDRYLVNGWVHPRFGRDSLNTNYQPHGR